MTFATCVDWKRTVVSANAPLGEGAHAIEAFWQVDGTMLLKVDKKLVARGKAPGTLRSRRSRPAVIGADRVKPVGDYESENLFSGTISALRLRHRR